MAFFRQYIAPFFVLLVFLVALLAVSIRIFLPSDMAAPAPIEEDVESASKQAPASEVDPTGGKPAVNAPTLPTSAGKVN
ncbi:MAG TPA: hypothetical protein V6D48_04335 [Oculatellaceae cyanobacterium]